MVKYCVNVDELAEELEKQVGLWRDEQVVKGTTMVQRQAFSAEQLAAGVRVPAATHKMSWFPKDFGATATIGEETVVLVGGTQVFETPTANGTVLKIPDATQSLEIDFFTTAESKPLTTHLVVVRGFTDERTLYSVRLQVPVGSWTFTPKPVDGFGCLQTQQEVSVADGVTILFKYVPQQIGKLFVMHKHEDRILKQENLVGLPLGSHPVEPIELEGLVPITSTTAELTLQTPQQLLVVEYAEPQPEETEFSETEEEE